MPLFSRKETLPFIPRVASSGGTRPGTRYYTESPVMTHVQIYEGNICAYLILTGIGRSVPVIQVAVPKIKLQPLSTPTKMYWVA